MALFCTNAGCERWPDDDDVATGVESARSLPALFGTLALALLVFCICVERRLKPLFLSPPAGDAFEKCGAASRNADEREAGEDWQQLVDDEAQVEYPHRVPHHLRRVTWLVEVQVEHEVHNERSLEQQLHEQRDIDGPLLPHASVSRAEDVRKNEENN